MEREESEEMQALNDATQSDPRMAPYGYFARSDFNLASIGMLFWFDSPGAIFRSIRDLQPHVYKDAAGDLSRRLETVLGCTDELRLTGALLGKVNEAARGSFELPWWGSFDQLCSGDSKWLQECRAEFREDSLDDIDGDADAGPIRESEVDAFVQFLKGYGY